MIEDKSRYWNRHISAWQKSGLSQERYCRKNNIRKSTFGYWYTKLSKRNVQNNLVQIPVMIPTRIGLEVVIRDNIKVVITPGFDPELLKAIVKTLEGRYDEN